MLWGEGYLNENVFKRCAHALPELEKRIIEDVNAVPRDVCVRTVQNFRDRLQQCVAANSRHLENFSKLHMIIK